ncbi:MAG: hypothetical protein WAV93_00970 [Bacteroidales bacterium]
MIIHRIFRKAGWYLEALSWLFAAPLFRWLLKLRDPVGITIGVTTYKDRYSGYLKPLLSKLHNLFPKDQIIIIANGHYQERDQEAYISELNRYCKRFDNAEVESYTEPRGLSFLWNRILHRARYGNVLILNDDIMIKSGFRRFIAQKKFMDASIVLINNSFSHFKITVRVPEKIGYFDEGFREIGGEDDDYLARLAMAGVSVESLTTGTVAGRKTRKSMNRVNSYGKVMSEERGGYSTLNTEYLESKWIMSDTYFEGAINVPYRTPKYWKLKNN